MLLKCDMIACFVSQNWIMYLKEAATDKQQKKTSFKNCCLLNVMIICTGG